MAGINQVTIVGRLGRDPEIKTTPSGATVANFSVATSENRPDSANPGQWLEHTEWHNIVVWNKNAENCAKYLAKGREVCVIGKLQTRSWEKDGHKNYRTEIVADKVQFLGGGQQASKTTEPAATAMKPVPVAATPAFEVGSAEEIPF